MKIIIAGAGEVGLHLSKLLSFESHDITLIDDNDVSLKDGENYLDIKVISGDASSISILNQANVKDSDLFIAVTSSESINLLTCCLAKKIGSKRTIGRITNPDDETGHGASRPHGRAAWRACHRQTADH